MADDALSRLQQVLGRDPDQSGVWQAPPGFWDALMKPPTDLPLPSAMPMNLAGGDRVFQPGGTIGAKLGMNEAGIYGRSVPMGNQDTVVPAMPQVPAMPMRGGINPNALPLILRRVQAANLQMPQPGAAPLQAGDWEALRRLLRDAGIGQAEPAQTWQSPLGVTGDWSRGLTGKNPPMLPGWQARLQLPPVQF